MTKSIPLGSYDQSECQPPVQQKHKCVCGQLSNLCTLQISEADVGEAKPLPLFHIRTLS